MTEDLHSSLITKTEGRAVRSTELANQILVRLGTWLVVGHAGALLLCFNGLLDHKICNWPEFLPFVHLFAGGMVAAFVSMALTRWTEMQNSSLQLAWASTARMEAAGKDVAAQIKQNDNDFTVLRWMGIASFGTLVFSALIFLGALLQGLSAPGLAAAVCPT